MGSERRRSRRHRASGKQGPETAGPGPPRGRQGSPRRTVPGGWWPAGSVRMGTWGGGGPLPLVWAPGSPPHLPPRAGPGVLLTRAMPRMGTQREEPGPQPRWPAGDGPAPGAPCLLARAVSAGAAAANPDSLGGTGGQSPVEGARPAIRPQTQQSRARGHRCPSTATNRPCPRRSARPRSELLRPGGVRRGLGRRGPCLHPPRPGPPGGAVSPSLASPLTRLTCVPLCTCT